MNLERLVIMVEVNRIGEKSESEIKDRLRRKRVRHYKRKEELTNTWCLVDALRVSLRCLAD